MYSGTLSQGQLMVSYDALTRKRVNQSWEKKGFFTRRLAIRPWASLLIPFAIIFSLFWIAHQIDKPGHLVSGNRQEAGHIQHRLNRLKALNHAFVRAQAHSRSIAAKRAQELLQQVSQVASYGLLYKEVEEKEPEIVSMDTFSDKIQPLSERARLLQSNLPGESKGDDAPPTRRQPRNPFEGVYPKVWVYPLPAKFNTELSQRYKRCISDQYGTEILFHRSLAEAQDIRVDDAKDADFFFVPIYGECFLWSHEMLRKEPHTVAFGATNQFFLEAMSIIREEYQWWNKTNGRDHVFVFAGARGPTIFQEWEDHIANSIFLIPEGDREWASFNTWKDIVIPGLEYDEKFTSISSHEHLVENPPRRKYLAHFRGTIHHPAGYAYSKGLRPRLESILKDQPDVIYDTKKKDCNRSCYQEEMTLSQFCLNPLGWTPWTLRFYQAIFVGCIPVMIANNVEFPYEDWLDYSELTLKIPESSVDDIVDVMRKLPERVQQSKRESMEKTWKAFSYQTPSEEGDAFYTVINLLNKKKRATRNSPVTSWQ